MYESKWKFIIDKLTSLRKIKNNRDQYSHKEELEIIRMLLFIPAGFLWGLVYITLGESQSGYIPIIYSFSFGISFILFLINKKPRYLSTFHRVLALIFPLLLQISLGGFISGSAVIIWSFLSPLSVLLNNKQKDAIRWFLGFGVILIISGIINPYIIKENNLSEGAITILFILNLLGVLGSSYMLLLFVNNQKNNAYKQLTIEQQKSDSLLENILPAEIAQILKNENRLIAEFYPDASILFADLVGFTKLTTKMSPIEMVELLNEIYTHFDLLVEKYGLEKIRTIGDNYMVASGVPISRPDHAQAILKMAIDINTYINSFREIEGGLLQFRIGINSGSLTAGVVGKKKFQFDVWGDMVNVASRMESQGVPGRIHISEHTYKLLKDEYQFESRGTIDIKGKGEKRTWLLSK
jgi:adenylate cyclase